MRTLRRALTLSACLLLAPELFAEEAEVAPPHARAPALLKEHVSLVGYEGADLGVARQVQLPLGKSQSMIKIQSVPLGSGRADIVVDGPTGVRGGMLTHGTKFAAVTTGGRLTVVVKGNAITVVTMEREALVGFEGKFKPLAAGMLRRIDAKSGDYSDEPLLRAPKSSARPPIAGSLEGPVVAKLPAEPVPGAAGYIVRLYEANSDVLVHEEFQKEAPEIRVSAPRAGRFRAHLFAVDKSGLEGLASPPIVVRVLGVEDTELVRFGSVYLEPGKRARVVGTEGLLMRYGSSTELVPAADAISIVEPKATSVEFRDPGDPKNSVVFPIQPELVHADIHLGKATAEWPRDPLDFRVVVRSVDGRPIENLDAYEPRVTVNLAEVPLEWTKDGSTLIARLEPQPGPGPWVVRLRLKNDKGIEIARSFLEVTEERVAPPTLYASSRNQEKNRSK